MALTLAPPVPNGKRTRRQVVRLHEESAEVETLRKQTIQVEKAQDLIKKVDVGSILAVMFEVPVDETKTSYEWTEYSGTVSKVIAPFDGVGVDVRVDFEDGGPEKVTLTVANYDMLVGFGWKVYSRKPAWKTRKTGKRSVAEDVAVEDVAEDVLASTLSRKRKNSAAFEDAVRRAVALEMVKCDAKFADLYAKYGVLSNGMANINSKFAAGFVAGESARMAERRTILDRKSTLFEPLGLTSVDPTVAERLQLWPKVFDGRNTGSFSYNPTRTGDMYAERKGKVKLVTSPCGQIVKHGRCVFYLHTTDEGKSCCLSLTPCVIRYDDKVVTLVYNTEPIFLPVAIMETDAFARAFGKNSVLDLNEAYELWSLRKACSPCAGSSSLRFIVPVPMKGQAEKHTPYCFFCLDTVSTQKKGGLRLCDGCNSAVSKDGRAQGGDDWSKFLMRLSYRFPWLEFDADVKPDNTKFSGTDNTKFDPDTVIKVRVEEPDGPGKTLWLVLEEDGDHSNYDVKDEYGRLKEMLKFCTRGAGHSVFVIRYIPKADTVANGVPLSFDKEARLIVVRQWAVWWVKSMLSKTVMPNALVLYLFYNDSDKHFLMAHRELADIIGHSHTAPQVVTDTDAEYDWRFALHPAEGKFVRDLHPLRLPISNAFPRMRFWTAARFEA
jgi:hypothetical protein